MSECLYIRLASHSSQKMQWLIWNASQSEVIGSGEVANASELSSLTEKASNRQVVAFAPACDVLLKSLTVPGKSQRAIKMAAPYMLEEDLADDVEQLFFAFADIKVDEQGNNCFVAVVKDSLMQQWLAWFTQANIVCRTILVDCLNLPLQGDDWSAIAIDDQILLRKGIWQGAVLDNVQWQLLANQWQSVERVAKIHRYSPLPELPVSIEVIAEPEELPLAQLVQGNALHNANNSTHQNGALQKQANINLLQGQFVVKQKQSQAIKYWLWAASFCLCAVLLNLGLKSAKLYQLSNQQAAVEQRIIDTYKDAFPATKRVRVSTIRSQMKRKLAELGSAGNNVSFLPMLAKLQSAFDKVPGLKPSSLKFDGKRNEIRLQAQAKDYQSFEQFKVQLEQSKLTVTQGAQNNQGDSVTGSLSIKG